MSVNYSFWLLAYQQEWAAISDLQQVIITKENSFGEITIPEYYEISKDKEYLKNLVVDGDLSDTDYKTITGEDYKATTTQ